MSTPKRKRTGLLVRFYSETVKVVSHVMMCLLFFLFGLFLIYIKYLKLLTLEKPILIFHFYK
jgi:hypothetical protein